MPSLTCTLAKEVQLFPGLGLHSGIFAMYLQCSWKRSGTALILYYAVCLLYVLSTAAFVSDLVNLILSVSNNSIYKNIIFYQLCRRELGHYRLNFKLIHSQCYFAFRLFNP